jgi:hypothetical protein
MVGGINRDRKYPCYNYGFWSYALLIGLAIELEIYPTGEGKKFFGIIGIILIPLIIFLAWVWS